ncbi:NPC intracellular cholesterol transporter 2-like [Uranotaenia lowii]|uniref:NPC intracellular cholesterol transporter 2-like n=1 Tax=Uranotaenia lowii TaxID=190385 RepID=UPI0024799FC5|nr:NPC intracellular cholesterol transporter 2-like [Uranotaenia lowii]
MIRTKLTDQSPKMFKFLLVAVFIPALATAVQVRSCGAGYATPEEVTIEGCAAGTNECQVQVGTTLRATATLAAAPRSSPTAFAHIIARLAGIQVPFPMPDALRDACVVVDGSGLETGCPVVAGERMVYNLNAFMDPNDFSIFGVTIEAEVRIDVTDTVATNVGDSIACARFNLRVVQ